MPLSIVSSVVFGADSANSRGAQRRRSAIPQPKAADLQPAFDDALEETLSGAVDDADEAQSSTAGLWILAQALAAYSQN